MFSVVVMAQLEASPAEARRDLEAQLNHDGVANKLERMWITVLMKLVPPKVLHSEQSNGSYEAGSTTPIVDSGLRAKIPWRQKSKTSSKKNSFQHVREGIVPLDPVHARPSPEAIPSLETDNISSSEEPISNTTNEAGSLSNVVKTLPTDSVTFESSTMKMSGAMTEPDIGTMPEEKLDEISGGNHSAPVQVEDRISEKVASDRDMQASVADKGKGVICVLQHSKSVANKTKHQSILNPN